MYILLASASLALSGFVMEWREGPSGFLRDRFLASARLGEAVAPETELRHSALPERVFVIDEAEDKNAHLIVHKGVQFGLGKGSVRGDAGIHRLTAVYGYWGTSPDRVRPLGYAKVALNFLHGSDDDVSAVAKLIRGRLPVIVDEEMSFPLPIPAADHDSLNARTNVGPQFSSRYLALLPKGNGNQERADEAQEYRKESIISRIAGSVRRFPLSAQIAAALVLAVLAASVLFSGYVVDGIDNPARARLKIGGGLVLLCLSSWLWLLGAP